MAEESYLDRVYERAFERLELVMARVAEQMEAPKPSQDRLRAAFDALVAAPDAAGFEQEYLTLAKQLGPDEVSRQMDLAVARIVRRQNDEQGRVG